MKTTIEIPDALADAARRTAREQRTTLRDLVVSGLRSELDRRESAPTADFHFPTYGGHGLVLDVAADEAIERSYGMTR